MQYRYQLHTCAKIVRGFAADNKMKYKLETMGLISYLACENESNAKLRGAETKGIIKLTEMDGDEGRSVIIESIIEKRTRGARSAHKT